MPKKHLTKKDLPWVILLLLGVTVLGFIFPNESKAEDVILNWTNPTEQEECTNAGPTTIDGVNVWQLVGTAPSAETTYTIPGMKPGIYTYAATAYNSDGESRLSGVTEKTVTEWVTIATQAKIVAKINGDFLLLVVGTVPLGTPCNPNVTVNGHYAIPKEAVTFTGAEDVIVVAQCG
jgi:hypothetical protein